MMTKLFLERKEILTELTMYLFYNGNFNLIKCLTRLIQMIEHLLHLKRMI